MTTAQQKLESLQKTLSFMFNVKIEITIRGLNDFTMSFEGKEKATSIQKWLKKGAKNISSLYDEELNETFIYFSGK